MKRLLKKSGIVMVLVLSLFALSSCGKKSMEEVTGNTYECKQFSALCPEDWVNCPVMELNKDTIAINHLRFCKAEVEEGQEIGSAIYSNAYIDIAHYPANSEIYENMNTYSNIEDVALEINGTKWKGHSGELAGYKDVYLWIDGQVEWQVSIRLSDNDGDIELDDFDIQAILASLKLK